MEQKLVLPDGTEIEMPLDIARNMSYAMGIVNGAVETLQMGTIAGKVPGVNVAAAAFNRAVVKLISNGTMRRVASRAAGHMIAGGGQNVMEEMVQEVVSVYGTEIAMDLVQDRTGAEREEYEAVGQRLLKQIGEVASIAPAFAIMSLPAAGVSATRTGLRDRAAQRDNRPHLRPDGALRPGRAAQRPRGA